MLIYEMRFIMKYAIINGKISAKLAGIGAVTGSIESGKCADMIVTRDNPLEDLRALRNVDMVIARGNIYDNPKFKVRKNVVYELDKYLNV